MNLCKIWALDINRFEACLIHMYKSIQQAQESLLHDECERGPSPACWGIQGKVSIMASRKAWAYPLCYTSLSAQTTWNSKYSRNWACVIDPSATVFEIIPSIVSNPSAEKRCPWTNTFFFTAWGPQDLPDVYSSFDTSLRKPSCSGEYWEMCHM